MHSDELLLKQALVSEVRPDLAEVDLLELRRAFAAQPNVESGWVADRVYLLAATAERPRMRSPGGR